MRDPAALGTALASITSGCPYAQMRTAPLPLPVVRTEGTRIHLADGRELIDGIASWWTACPAIIIRISGRLFRNSSRSCRM